MTTQSASLRLVQNEREQGIAEQHRKSGINRNKEGSVRNIGGMVYVDFVYLSERVREPSGLTWNESNAKLVRKRLDKIMIAIEDGTFRFHDVFPDSRRKEHFRNKELECSKRGRATDEVLFREAAEEWYEVRRSSQRVRGRTLYGYRFYMDRYLLPYFGSLTFSQLNATTFEAFVGEARKGCHDGGVISNRSINKAFVPLRMICAHVAVKHGWSSFNPFFGFKKLSEDNNLERILPFTLKEQEQIQKALPAYWKPYFAFAFCSGLRPGEQIGIKPGDINWFGRELHVRRAITLNEAGKRVEGETKNRFSRRTIKLNETMYQALLAQKEMQGKLSAEFFFCTPLGSPVHLSNLRKDVWLPSLIAAGLKVRAMQQTRHSFATNALSLGESPLWVARVMGHRDTDMVIKVYARYVENSRETEDGVVMARAYRALDHREASQ